jgi:hypothetical protein
MAPHIEVWQTPDGRYHAEVTCDDCRALAHARGAIRQAREQAGTWAWQSVEPEADERTTHATSYFVETS